MKIPDLDAATLRAAVAGHLDSIDVVLLAIQPGVFNLALRMLANRDDASDATQEILLKVVTHLASFRGDAAFGTWVFGIARNHLLTALTRSKESPEVSLEGLAARLSAGLAFGASLADVVGGERSLSPEDKLAARQVALGCTQGMLMALDREQRLAYLLDAVFGLSSQEAAQVLDISSDAYRKRLSRVRETLDPFVRQTCGLANADAACRCDRQLPAIRHRDTLPTAQKTMPMAIHRDEMDEAGRHFDAMLRMSDAAAVFRGHPQYRAPASMIDAIRGVLRQEGYWRLDERRPLQ